MSIKVPTIAHIIVCQFENLVFHVRSTPTKSLSLNLTCLRKYAEYKILTKREQPLTIPRVRKSMYGKQIRRQTLYRR